MKTAVLITGHPRTYDKTHKSLYENCILPNQSDVFLSVWTEDEAGQIINLNRLGEVYNPILIDSSSVRDYENEKEKFVFLDRAEDCFRTNVRAYLSKKSLGTHHIERIRSQWYRVKRGMQAIAASGKYDIVIRIRFDIKLNGRVDLLRASTGNSRGCFVPKLLESVRQDHFISCGLKTPVMTDHWCYGPWESMMRYGLLYDNLLPMYRDENVPISNAEEMFAYFMLTRVAQEHYTDNVPYELVR